MSDAERGLDVDHRADRGRDVCDPPAAREHDSYRAPRWATAHVEEIDRLFACGLDGGCEVRIDLDGVGSGGASLHDYGENVNLSVWLDAEAVDRLIRELAEARRGGES